MKYQTKKYLKKKINNKTKKQTLNKKKTIKHNKKQNVKYTHKTKPHTLSGGFTLFKRRKLRNRLRNQINKCIKNNNTQTNKTNCKTELENIIGKFNYEFYEKKDTNIDEFKYDLYRLLQKNTTKNTTVSKEEVNNIINKHIKNVKGLSTNYFIDIWF